MEVLYTNQRGLEFFLSCTGTAFEGRYPGKISNVEEVAIEVMKPHWISNKPPATPKSLIN
jgi:hypothetical protein